MKRPRIVIRFDAGRTVGLGHAVRCVALAQALAVRGARIAIAANAPGQAVVRRAAPEADWPMHAARTSSALRHAWKDGCAALIVDSYVHDATFEQACRGWAGRIVAIDDLPNRGHDCDLLLDQTLGRRAAEYRRLVPPRARILAGHRYTLLRPMFIRARRGLRRRFRRGDRRILVTLGGGDHSARLGELLRTVPRTNHPLSVQLLASSPGPVARAGIEVVIGDLAVAPRFASADVAITAAGSTTWEMCCLGLPMVLMPIAPNQRDVAAKLAKRRLAAMVANGDPKRAWREALALLADPRRRRLMSQAGRRLIDGGGAGRAADAILAMIGSSR